MGLMKRMKDILFDDEEEIVEEKKVIKEEVVKEKEITPPIIEKIQVPVKEEKLEDTKELPSPFMDFDEDEFVNSIPQIPTEKPSFTPRKTEVASRSVKPKFNEYERKTTIEKKTEYGRYEKTETVEIKEKRKFKPSLIISPVYGVLNEDYTPDDIKHKVIDDDKLDIDVVRKKAYGDLEKLEQTIEEPVESFYEEKVSVKPMYESDEKVKTIDELLSISADKKIEIDDMDDEFSMTEELDLNSFKNNKEEDIKIYEEEDTLESDLFDLIDSMYESKEEVI